MVSLRRIKGIARACGYSALALCSGAVGAALMPLPWTRRAGQSLLGLAMGAVIFAERAIEDSRRVPVPGSDITFPEQWTETVPAEKRAEFELAFYGRLITVDESEIGTEE